MPENLPTSTVAALADDLVFLSDSQDVYHLTEYFGGRVQHRFNAYFVRAVDGEYVEVWGMFGIIPFLARPVYRIL